MSARFNPGDVLTIATRSYRRDFTVVESNCHRTVLDGQRGARRVLVCVNPLTRHEGIGIDRPEWAIHEDDGERNRGRPCTVDDVEQASVVPSAPRTSEVDAPRTDPVGDAREFVNLWQSTGYGKAVLTASGDSWRLELVTGGWSGNESLLDAVPMSIRMHWLSSHRGGLHIYGRLDHREEQIRRECDAIADMLAAKNADYGDSALSPLRVFSKADAAASLRVRIDDKLSRLARGRDAGEDTVKDLIGYLVLLRIAESP